MDEYVCGNEHSLYIINCVIEIDLGCEDLNLFSYGFKLLNIDEEKIIEYLF